MRCYGCPSGVSRQRDEVRAMVASGNDCPRLFALTRIHDAVRCSSSAGILRGPRGLLCGTRNSLGLFRLHSRFLAFYGHLKRLPKISL